MNFDAVTAQPVKSLITFFCLPYQVSRFTFRFQNLKFIYGDLFLSDASYFIWFACKLDYYFMIIVFLYFKNCVNGDLVCNLMK